MKARDKIKRARVQLNDLDTGSPFFGHLTMHLDLVEKEEIPTMAVDYNGNMYYNPEFVNQMTDEEIKGVVCHEVMHLALKGKMRKEGRKHQVWNLAQDVVINYILRQNDFQLPTEAENPKTGETNEYPVPQGNSIELPSHDGKIKIENLEDHSFESIYDILHDEMPEMESKVKVKITQKDDDEEGSQSGQGGGQADEEDEEEEQGNDDQGQGQGNGDDEDQQQGGGSNGQVVEIEVDMEDVGDNPLGIDDHIYEGDEEGGEEGEGKDWEQIMAEAVSQAKQRGEMPSGMDRRVDQVLEPDVSWKTLLHRYISRKVSVDYTYQKPSKKTRTLRSNGHNTYLPGVEKQGLDVVVALDLSGSIGSNEAAHYLGEIRDIAKSFEQVDMKIIQHDAKVTQIDDMKNVRPHDIEDLELKGGGGTDHKPVFEKMENMMTDAEIMINLTDGYTSTPDEAPSGLDVIWVINNHSVEEEDLGFGRIVRADYHD